MGGFSGMDSQWGALCERCQQFDFDSILDPIRMIPPPTGTPIKSALADITDVLGVAVCPLCRLIAAVRCAGESRTQSSAKLHHFRAYSSLRIYDLRRSEFCERLKPNVVLTVERGEAKFDTSYHDHFQGDVFVPCGLIAEVPPAPAAPGGPGSLHGCVVNPNSIDFDHVRDWLHHCDNQHPRSCGKQVLDQVESLKVIDCDTRNIIRWSTLNNESEYFALSYVWGSPVPQENPISDSGGCKSLPASGVPKVIEEAMEVVKNLQDPSRRFLWVDKYCIDHEMLMIRTIRSVQWTGSMRVHTPQ